MISRIGSGSEGCIIWGLRGGLGGRHIIDDRFPRRKLMNTSSRCVDIQETNRSPSTRPTQELRPHLD
jgi:hypothetical protein